MIRRGSQPQGINLSDCVNATTAFVVRDYECDMQGHVNNGVYFNYFEHARHELLARMGVDLKSLVTKGIQLVAHRVEINYLKPLKSQDSFTIETSLTQMGLRFAFTQTLKCNQTLFATAEVSAVAITETGKPLKWVTLDTLKT